VLHQRIHLYSDNNEELAAVACRTKLVALLDANAVISPLLVLAVAAYFPLYTLNGARRLLDANLPSSIDAVLRQQVIEPLEERALRTDIGCLTPITVVCPKKCESVRGESLSALGETATFNNVLRFNDELRRSVPFGFLYAID